jgi:uncharacterized protein YecE (DUF72 family)
MTETGYRGLVSWRVGTSGWQYRDWRGDFYPQRLPQRLWLEHYTQTFDTVEVNNAFYRLPERSVFEGWKQRTPAGFVVTVKGSRYLTHIKRLKEPAEPVARLLDRCRGLGRKRGPILLQLPPTLQAAPDLLDETLKQFPRTVRVAVEPRHDSWWSDEVRAVLTRRKAALVWADRGEQALNPLWVTAGWGYLRLHHGRPDWAYSTRALQRWADQLRDCFTEGYAYANNDPGGAAPRDAVKLREMLER